MEDSLFYGDIVKAKVDVYKNDKVFVPIGTKGRVVNPSYVSGWADVVFEGKVHPRYVHSDDLEIVIKNEKGRIEHDDNEKKLKAKMKDINVTTNSIIEVKGIFSRKVFKVYVTNVLDTGVYGYRLTKSGERCKGKLGVETYFTVYQIYTPARKEEDNKKIDSIQEGFYCLMSEARMDNIIRVGIVEKTTSRSIYVDWGKKKYRYGRKEFRYHALPKNEIQERINNKTATFGAIERLNCLGFDTKSMTVQEEYKYSRQ